jgi:hypothetical protein
VGEKEDIAIQKDGKENGGFKADAFSKDNKEKTRELIAEMVPKIRGAWHWARRHAPISGKTREASDFGAQAFESLFLLADVLNLRQTLKKLVCEQKSVAASTLYTSIELVRTHEAAMDCIQVLAAKIRA